MKKVLLIIDPQNDFIDDKDQMGSLAVSGAYDDMKRLAKYMKDNITEINSVVTTVDTHSTLDVAHHSWWVDQTGTHPSPFTLITLDDVQKGVWKTTDPKNQASALEYVKQLQEQNKYELRIWPDHCIENTWGHQIFQDVDEATALLSNHGAEIKYVIKGTNPYTEHYSGFKAEVPMLNDKTTELNIDMIKYLDSFDCIEVSGEALSHCVAFSVRDLVSNIKNPSKVVLLTNTMNPVTGYQAQADEFLNEMKSLGVQLSEVPELSTSKKFKVK